MNSFKNNKNIWEKSDTVEPYDLKKGWLGELLPPEITFLNL